MSKWSAYWRRYSKNTPAVIGLIIVIFFSLVAILAPWILPYDPLQIGAGDPLQPPSIEHIMGTDDLGRDIFSGVLYGARVSLFVGFVAAAISTGIGILIGVNAGYYGGKIDNALMRITEIFLTIPGLLLLLVLVAIFGQKIWYIVVVIGITIWPSTARLVRAEFLTLRERGFVEAAKALGARDFYIIFSEILPNALPSIIVNASLQVANAIMMEAGASFLGLSDPTLISWGRMISNAQLFIRHAWWMAFFPGLSICLLVLAFNLVGEGLNIALSPRLTEK